MNRRFQVIGWAAMLSLLLPAAGVQGAGITVNADPSNYKSLLGTLKPGDTMNLASGTYPLLGLSGLNGSAGNPITIQGPAGAGAAVISIDPGNPDCCNIVQLGPNAYIVLRNLTVDSVNGVGDGINAKGGITHDILIENCILKGQGSDQGIVGISTKDTAWNWVIRGNTITGAGTGMYLGNSTGDSPFINGLIEGNLIQDTIGYNTEIKWQAPYALPPGLDAGPHKTIIRNNVWIKSVSLIAAPGNERPNLLVDGFPASGPGSGDSYEIYGNFFYENKDGEALFQGSGSFALHDNIFVGGSFAAVNLRDHDLPLKRAYFYNNTIYGHVTGVSLVNGGSLVDSLVTGNLILADSGISAPSQKDNIVDSFANAANYVKQPSLTLGAMDFFPLAGKAKGTALDMSKFTGNVNYDVDFNGTSKGTFLFRGAYAGEGTNTGWALDRAKKIGGATIAPPPVAPKNLRIR